MRRGKTPNHGKYWAQDWERIWRPVWATKAEVEIVKRTLRIVRALIDESVTEITGRAAKVERRRLHRSPLPHTTVAPARRQLYEISDIDP